MIGFGNYKIDFLLPINCPIAAFSFFAFCEYLIASANMAFHWTCTLDFPTEDFLIANCTGPIRQVYEEQFVVKDENEKKVTQEEVTMGTVEKSKDV